MSPYTIQKFVEILQSKMLKLKFGVEESRKWMYKQ